MTTIGRHNIAKMTTSTLGTGTVTLGAAVAGCLSFASAGAVDGETLSYVIREGTNTEVGRGVYTASGTTLTRATILSSTNSGSAITLTGRATVSITLAAEDILQRWAGYYGQQTTVSDTTDNQDLSLDTEFSDETSLASVSSDALTVAEKGQYQCYLSVYIIGGADFNGRVKLDWAGFFVQKGYTTAMAIGEDNIYIGPFTLNNSTVNHNLGTIKFSNHTGTSIDIYVNEIVLIKIGNKL